MRSFLLEMFGATGPDQAPDSLTARQMLDRRRDAVAEGYADDPETRAEMELVLAEGYERLGLNDDAEPLAQASLDRRRALFGETHPDVVVSLNVLGWLRHQAGDLAGADTLLRRSVDVGREVFGPAGDPRLARALNDLGIVSRTLGDGDRSVALLEESLTMRRRLLGEQHLGVAITTSNLSVAHYDRGNLEAAVRMAESALLRFVALLGPDHQRTLIVRQNLASLQTLLGDRAGAVARGRRVLEVNVERLGEAHPTVANNRMMLASSLLRMAEPREAELLLDQAVEALEAAFPAGHPDLATSYRLLGDTKSTLGDTAQAMREYRLGLATAERVVGRDHEVSAVLLGRIAELEARAGNDAAAHEAFREASTTAVRILGGSHSTALELYMRWIEFLIAEGDREQTRVLLAELEEGIVRVGDLNPAWLERLEAARAAVER